ncbi:MAG: site-specific integrase, partial [Acidobacteriota bacterium]
MQRLLDAVRGVEHLELLVVLAVSTGARRGELLSLRWPDIDLGRRQAIVQHSKNGDRRVLPLHGRALDLLCRHGQVRPIDDDRLFPIAGFPRSAWERARRAAGLNDLRFHDLRHTAASHLAMHGATLVELAEILGHRSLQMVRRYAHLTEA